MATSIQALIQAAAKVGLTLEDSTKSAKLLTQSNVAQSLQLNGKDYIDYLDKNYQTGSVETELALSKFITQDSATLAMLDHIRSIAMRSDAVLIEGPPGTGKELLARALHGYRVGSFIAINCAELSHNLIRAELFGHMKNTFTGSGGVNREGLVVAADRGTLFLDEIGELSMEFQGILLRLLESRTYRPLGHNGEELYTNTRFVFATNRNLAHLVEQGTFRQDLYDRINVLRFTIPSLQRRGLEEIKLICNSLGGDHDSYVAAMDTTYTQYTWPGNVRELRNFITRVKLLGMVYAIESM